MDESFQSNNISIQCTNNSTGILFKYNTIGYYFNNNNISDTFSNNIIGILCEDNLIDYDFKSNIIKDNFNNNYIADNFQFNTIGSIFNHNYIDTNFTKNSILIGDISHCTMSGYFRRNNITMDSISWIDFTDASFVYGDYDKNIFKNSVGNSRLSYISSDDVIMFTAMTASS